MIYLAVFILISVLIIYELAVISDCLKDIKDILEELKK